MTKKHPHFQVGVVLDTEEVTLTVKRKKVDENYTFDSEDAAILGQRLIDAARIVRRLEDET